MMRGRRGMAIAVRTPKNDINLHEERLQSLSSRYPILKRPIIRGTVALIESLTLGMRSLNHSASVAAEGEGEELSTKELVLTVALAVALTVGLFIMFPAFIVRIIQERVASNILLNLLEGLVKITVFVGYIVAIGFFPDIRRVFEYHGAEHKAINCLESGQELTVDNAKGHTTIHARCGTNFLLIVFFTSVFLFSFFGRPPFLQRVLLHLALLPVVAGISYEIIKQAGKQCSSPIFRLIAYPGMQLQRLTTREPDEEQLEVAIKALEAVRAADAELGEPASLESRRKAAKTP
ncbi:MAG: DUF1385 domain-containing protein [Firmicutes bacterium]|nr:DUF1385 domain-containing protein [Bacillota bacterium]